MLIRCFSSQDGIVSAIYTLLWLIAAIVATTYAACFGSGKLGVASVRLYIPTCTQSYYACA